MMITIPRPKYDRLVRLYGIWLRKSKWLETETLRARLLTSFAHIENGSLLPTIDGWASCLPPNVYLRVDYGYRELKWEAIVDLYHGIVVPESLHYGRGATQSTRALDAFLLELLDNTEQALKAEAIPYE